MDRVRMLAARLPFASRRSGWVFAPVAALLLLGSLLVGVSAAAAEPSLLLGVLGALLCAWGLAAHGVVVLPTTAVYGPAIAARDHHRALARRAVPRQRDPDAAGHTRSRAPSGLFPAV
ncbi:DUF6412 domain-containing protein [Pseudonocardia sp. GCM10023141]|uniref:DUF6412 domain-containing protein n=1 Tax=Pseudonocardia sp. GCM10023141 TaxID=3252653 RepID=UPI00361B9E36